MNGEIDLPKEPKYYLIDAEVMPSVLHKVLEAKFLLESGQCKTASEAAAVAEISRSAFYKYKDAIRPFYDKEIERIVTFYLELKHEPGVLSNLLIHLAKVGLNILTYNQNIPVDGKATAPISAQISGSSAEINELIDSAKECDGVIAFKLLAGN